MSNNTLEAAKSEPLYAAELRSVYDFSQEEFDAELARVYNEIAPEQAWLLASSQVPYESDEAILRDADEGHLTRVTAGVGYLAIQRLSSWVPERTRVEHPFHYSPPFLRRSAAHVLDLVASTWKAEQSEKHDIDLVLPVTSLVRSSSYQRGLTERSQRKVAVKQIDDARSGHEYALDFDIDGCGAYIQENETIRAIHPRNPEDYDAYAPLIRSSRQDLRNILLDLQDKQIVNIAEELPGTKEHCFHVGVNPDFE